MNKTSSTTLALLLASSSSWAAQPTTTTNISVSGEVVPNTCVVGQNRMADFGTVLGSSLRYIDKTAQTLTRDFELTLLTGCVPNSTVSITLATGSTYGDAVSIPNTGSMGGILVLSFSEGMFWTTGFVNTIDSNGDYRVNLLEISFRQYSTLYGSAHGAASFTVTYA